MLTKMTEPQDVNTSTISPFLFVTEEGEPMSFFVRPSPIKGKLQPLIVAGGGVLCRVQQPETILLIDPDEVGAITASNTQWYVSTKYIQDCVEKNEQLDLEHYCIKLGSSPEQNTSKNSYGGRLPYTAEEDAAILSYVSKCKAEIGGNRIWQEMEKERLTSHSWQSMKYRYRVRLAKQQSEEVVEKMTAEGDTEAETMIDAPSTSAEDMLAEMPVCPQEEKEADDPLTDQEETVEAESLDSPQQEPPAPEVAEPQTSVSPQEEPRPEDSSSVQPDSPLQVKKKPKSSSPSTMLPRRSTRRHSRRQKSPSPERYSRKLRSSANSEEQPSVSRVQPKRKGLAAQVDLKELEKVEDVPSKKAREEGENAQMGPDSASETEPAPQKETSKPKKPLGILQMAVMEFGDSSDSGEDEVTYKPAGAEPHLIPEGAAASPPSSPEPDSQEVLAACNGHQSPGSTAEGVDATSEAHLFIFDSESQEEAGSQATSGEARAPVLANMPPTVNTIPAFSLTQAQLEEDKRRITKLMSDTKQDLVSVTKALLKTSGDYSEARLLLLDSIGSGQHWHCCDDNLLMSNDPVVWEQLREKYDEEGIAKRIAFLELQA